MSSLTTDFLMFEAKLLAERYDRLKERDGQNFINQTKLFSFLIIYGAAPFIVKTGLSPQLLRAWGLGGIWLVVIVLFYCDRYFRAYGLHLKERIYCLYQLAVLRKIATHDDEVYSQLSLLPVGRLRAVRGVFHGFPERLSPGQIRTASYFYKFLGLFTLLYLVVFTSALLHPLGVVEGSARPALEICLLLSVVIAAWLYFSVMRCLDLQRIVFEARRISSLNPWPHFDKGRISSIFTLSRGYTCYKLSLGALAVSSFITSVLFGFRVLIHAGQELLPQAGDGVAKLFNVVARLHANEGAVWVEVVVVVVFMVSGSIFFLGSDRFFTRVLREMGRVYDETIEPKQSEI